MANSFNGIGSTFYGQSDFEQDGSFVTTKWFIVGFFPVFPLGSARLRYLDSTGIPFLSRESSFDMVEDLPIQWLQVLKTWIYTIFIIALTTTLLKSNAPVVVKLFFIFGGMFLPYILRWFAKRAAGVS
jgi:hypothetical protein